MAGSKKEAAITRIRAMLFLMVVMGADPAHAQAPTGTIAGIVTDPAGAPISGAEIRIINRETGLTRTPTTSVKGDYSAASLPSGIYQVTVSAAGFPQLEQAASVGAGVTTTVDFSLQFGGVSEKVTVTGAAPLIQYDHYQVGGLIRRAQIENLPRNGRNFLELAKLEPGSTNPIRGTNNRTFVPTLGAGLATEPRIGITRVTVDGGNILLVGGPGAALSVSEEAVQEFQFSSVNFDLPTGLTSNGAINVATRSGGAQYHGSGFYFYRDHHMAAYPGLRREPENPDPFFRRRQFGGQVGGPIRDDRVFFFAGFERDHQQEVRSIQPRTPEFTPLGGLFPSTFLGNQLNLRFDVLHPHHNAFVRYTHDGNLAFTPLGPDARIALPSGWSRVRNWADQSMAALTSVLSSSLVNDLRFSYFFHSSPETPAGAEDCPGCLGLGIPRTNIPDAGVVLGLSRRLSFVSRRYQWTESLTWQRGSHRVRFGSDWEHSTFSAQQISQEPASLVLYSPREVRLFNMTAPPEAQIPLPSAFLTVDDILRLPLLSFETSVGPGLALQRDFLKNRVLDHYRLYAGDTWRIGPRLTVNYGLAWVYEPHSLNTDLAKPALLTAILGSDGLKPPVAQKTNFSPMFGLAWSVTGDGKTVIRAGAGRYFDPVTFNSINIGNERLALSPAGTGRRANVPGSGILYEGRPLDFRTGPTDFTGSDLVSILPEIRAALMQQLDPDNRDFTFRNLDLNKTGLNLSDPSYETPYALHVSLGMQRELHPNLVLSADFAWRRFLHTVLPGVDYNRFERRINGVKTPVIPLCADAQLNDLSAVCSSGPITFDNTAGIAEYKGLLVRLEKRFTRRTQFLASYSLGSYSGTNSPGAGAGFNNDNWFENYGPLPSDRRHILNISGFIDLPWRFQCSFSVSAYSRMPFSAFVSNVDINGDGTQDDLLPGTSVNQFNRGLDKADLSRFVDRYNQEFAGRQTAGGQMAPQLMLPDTYAFNDSFFAQDLRLSRAFDFDTERVRLVLFGEVFNLLNTANLTQYSRNIANPAAFGQPGARSAQVFGSGGPRAFQLGTRVSF